MFQHSLSAWATLIIATTTILKHFAFCFENDYWVELLKHGHIHIFAPAGILTLNPIVVTLHHLFNIISPLHDQTRSYPHESVIVCSMKLAHKWVINNCVNSYLVIFMFSNKNNGSKLKPKYLKKKGPIHLMSFVLYIWSWDIYIHWSIVLINKAKRCHNFTKF